MSNQRLTDHDVIHETRADDGSPLYQNAAVSDPSSGEHGGDVNPSPDKPKENIRLGHGKRDTHTGRSEAGTPPPGKKSSVSSKLAGAVRGVRNVVNSVVERVTTPNSAPAPAPAETTGGQVDRWSPTEDGNLPTEPAKFDHGEGEGGAPKTKKGAKLEKKQRKAREKHLKRVGKFSQKVPFLVPDRMLGVLKDILEATPDAVYQPKASGGFVIVGDNIPEDVLKAIIEGKYSADTEITEEQSEILKGQNVSVLCIEEEILCRNGTVKLSREKHTPCAVGHCYRNTGSTEFCAKHDLEDRRSKSYFSDEQRSGDRKVYRLVNLARDIMHLPPKARLDCLQHIRTSFEGSVRCIGRKVDPTILLEEVNAENLFQLERFVAELTLAARRESVCELLQLGFKSRFPPINSNDEAKANGMDVRLPSLRVVVFKQNGVTLGPLCKEGGCLSPAQNNSYLGYCRKHSPVDPAPRAPREKKPSKEKEIQSNEEDKFQGVECSCEVRFSHFEDRRVRDLAKLVSSDEVAISGLGEDLAKMVDMIQNKEVRDETLERVRANGPRDATATDILSAKLRENVKTHKLFPSFRYDDILGFVYTLCTEREYSSYISYVPAERVLDAFEYGMNEAATSHLGSGAIFIPNEDAFVRNVLACTWGHTNFEGFYRLLTNKRDFRRVKSRSGTFLIHPALGEDAGSILDMKKSAASGMSKFDLMNCCPPGKIALLQESTVKNAWSDRQVDQKAKEYAASVDDGSSERRIPRKSAKEEEKGANILANATKISSNEADAETAASEAALQRRIEELEAEKAATEEAMQRQIEELTARNGELMQERDFLKDKAERLEKSPGGRGLGQRWEPPSKAS